MDAISQHPETGQRIGSNPKTGGRYVYLAQTEQTYITVCKKRNGVMIHLVNVLIE